MSEEHDEKRSLKDLQIESERLRAVVRETNRQLDVLNAVIAKKRKEHETPGQTG